MFDKEQPYPTFWQAVAATIRGDKLSKRQQLFRMLGLAFILLIGAVYMLVGVLRH